MLNEFTLKQWPYMNHSGALGNGEAHVDITDGDKGAAASHDRILNGAQRFLDYLHRFKALTKSASGAVAQSYKKLFYAKSRSELGTLKRDVPSQHLARLSQIADENQYPCCAGGTGLGHVRTSSPVESFNAKCLEMQRGVDFAHWIRLAVLCIADRHHRGAQNQREAAASKTTQDLIPPAIWEAMQRNYKRFLRHSADEVRFEGNLLNYQIGDELPADRCTALVTDRTNGITYRVDLLKLKCRNPGAACNCLYGVKKAVPCSHAWLVVKKLGLEMEQVMHHSLTWNGWNRHYHDAQGREIDENPSARRPGPIQAFDRSKSAKAVYCQKH